MAINRYDTPAEARFINTYAPLPFEQLYTLGKEAKASVDTALAETDAALAKWSEFQSPSAVDTNTWYNETIGRANPIINEMAANPDLIKSAEGRARLQSAIRNVDRAKLSTLLQSRENLVSRQKMNQELMARGMYNPEWHNVDFLNYDTTKAGTFNDVSPLAYKSIQDLTEPYYKGIQDSFLQTKGGYDYTGVTPEMIANIADTNFSGIVNTPEAQKHMELYRKQTGADEEQAKAWLKERVVQDNLKYARINREANKFALQNNAAVRSSKTPPQPLLGLRETMDATGAAVASEGFNKSIETFVTIAKQFKPKVFAEATPYLDKMATALQEFSVLANTPNANKEQLLEKQKEVMKARGEFASKYGKDVYKSVYMENSGNQDPDDPNNEQFSSVNHLQGLNGVLRANMWQGDRQIVTDILSAKMSGFSPTEYTEDTGAKIKDGVFLKRDTHGMHLPETLATLMMGTKGGSNRMIDGKDFNKDLQSGRFRNVIAEPTGNLVTYYDTSGKLVHEVEMETSIPKKSLSDAGYSEWTLLGKIGAGAASGAAVGAGVGSIFGGVGAVPGAGVGAAVGGIAGGIVDLFDGSINKDLHETYDANKKIVKNGDENVEYITIKTYVPVPDNKQYNDVIDQAYYKRVSNSTVTGGQLGFTQEK